MLTRRHLRAKVMQALYAYRQSHSQDMAVAEKNLLTGIDRIMDLYAMQTALLFSVVRMADAKIEARRGKRFATPEELNPNMKFVRNPVLAAMEGNKKLSEAASKYASSWADRSEYVEPPSDAPLDYYEDCNMEWAADIQVANTMLLKTMEDIKEENPSGFEIPSLYKDEGDREFAVRLLRETEKGSAQYKAMIEQSRKLGQRTNSDGRFHPYGNGHSRIYELSQHTYQSHAQRIHRNIERLFHGQKPHIRQRHSRPDIGMARSRRQNKESRTRAVVTFFHKFENTHTFT